MSEKAVLKRIGVLSTAKLCAVIGVFVGLILEIFSTIIFMLFAQSFGMGILGVGMGIYMIIILPIVYGLSLFVFGALASILYNLFAKPVGGIEMEFEEK